MVEGAGQVALEVDRTAATPWLTIEQQEAWKAVVTLLLLLPGPLDAQLQRDSGLTMFEYLVLSSLSMAPDRTVGMSELARMANGSLTRLSNVVKRLEQHGWVRREPDPHDGRCTVAILTASGNELVEAAAPGHVAAVRQHVIEPLTSGQLRTLTAIGHRIERRLNGNDDPRVDPSRRGRGCPGGPQ